MSGTRQPVFITVAGRKNVGKTYTTKLFIKKYLIGNKSKNVAGRKVLVLDTNNEKAYSKIKKISIKNLFNDKYKNEIKIFSSDINNVDIRRVEPIHPFENRPLTSDELSIVLEYLINNFWGGMLVVEDILKIISDSLKKDIVGGLATMRHRNCDVITHFQYKKKLLNPKIYGNTDLIRIHKTNDSFYDYLTHIKGDKNLLLLTEHLVDYKNKLDKYKIISKDNNTIYSYYAYADITTGKIIGEYNKNDVAIVIDEFISRNNNILKPLTNKIDSNGKCVYSLSEAWEIVKKQIADEYFGIRL